MSVSSISGTSSVSAFDPLSKLRPVAGQDTDKDSGAASGVAKQNNFASAIQQALTQFGISAPDGTAGTSTTATPTSDTADTADSTTQDPTQALNSFVQSLFAALHAQSGNSTPAAGNATASATAAGGPDAVAATSGGGKGHHHHGGAGKLESGLQNLIQQLGSGTSDTAATSAGGASTDSATGTATTAASDLQKSFNDLLGADGATGTSANLTSFLQALSQKLEGAPATGNVVNTKV